MALSSDRARQELERLQTRSSLVEALDDRRRALDSQLPDLPGRLDALRTEREITRLRDQVTTATDDLDKTLGAAARALDPLSFKLSRTRHRGVYRTGTRYLVPYVDEQGSERARDFDTLAQAHDFRLSVQAAEKAQKEYSGPDTGRGGAGRNA
jgi:hypothetical protein